MGTSLSREKAAANIPVILPTWTWSEDSSESVTCDFHVGTCEALEKQFKSDPTGHFELRIGSNTCTFNISEMSMMRDDNFGKRYKIQRREFQWFYRADDGIWEKYDNALAQKLEQKFRMTDEITFTEEMRNYYYFIDLKRMTQTNTTTKKQRDITRHEISINNRPSTAGVLLVPEPRFPDIPMWFWEDDNSRWQPYNDSIVSQLQNHYTTLNHHLNQTIGRYEYHIDLEAMTQRNVLTGKVRKIRRLN